MSNLKTRRVLVTGASAGIGYAIAKELAHAGAEVFAVARRKEKLLALQKGNSSIKVIVADIRSEISKIRESVGEQGIDVLINNAGLALGREPVQSTDQAETRTMFETNVLSLIEITQAFLPKMIERNDGDIVNLGSVAGWMAYAGGSVYCATKAAVTSLTDAWRLDLLGKGIRVIGIHPGMVETEFSEVRFRGDRKKAAQIYKGVRALQSQDIAETVRWTLERPRHVNIHSLLIMPTDQAGVGAGALYRTSE